MIISNNPMYKNAQQTPAKEETHSEIHKHDEHTSEHPDEHGEHHAHKESNLETTNMSSDSMVAISKMIASMLDSATQSKDIKGIYDKIHDLDKRLAVNEALLLHITKH